MTRCYQLAILYFFMISFDSLHAIAENRSDIYKQQLAQQLCKHGVVLFGDFILKSGAHSPVYFDFRLCQSHPSLFKMMVEQLAQKTIDLTFDVICGVPYGAVPWATGIGMFLNKPLIMCRKEAKQHGTQRIIEGMYKKGDVCVLVEDVITTGGSVLETIALLEQEGLMLHDIVVCIDRQAGGVELLEKHGYRVHALFTYEELLGYANGYAQKKTDDVLSYGQRIAYAHNGVAKKLFSLMEQKKTNLACAADVTTKQELLDLVDAIGSEICLLKTHIDIIKDFDEDLVKQLRERASRYNFLIAEDRKFADIGSTVEQQYTGGLYTISQWTDIIIAHALPGEPMIEVLKNNSRDDQAILLIAQMSSAHNLIDDAYTHKTVCLAEKYHEYVAGFITQSRCSTNPGFFYLRPGINNSLKTDQKGQCYVSAQQAVAQGADVIIVGRDIYAAKEQKSAAQQYREIAWQAYERRIRS